MTSPSPTLRETEASNRLQQLLKKQESCQSPCLWAITPGKTTLDDAQEILRSLGLPLIHTSEKPEEDSYATDFGFENGLSAAIVLTVRNGLIAVIQTNVGLINYTGSSLVRDWLAFSPDVILEQYGVPDRVDFHVSTPPYGGTSVPTISYTMAIYFEEIDLILEYDSVPVRDEEFIKICPLVDKFSGVGAWLGKDPENAPGKTGVTLQDAASLAPEQFYELMLQEPETACFNLSRAAFQ
jgi:hypothetical protein